MTKSLAQLKRDAKTGNMSLELIERFGSTGDDIPERLHGIRKVVSCNTVGFILKNANGQQSELRFENAKLTEYEGDTLTIYEPAYRDPNEIELAVLAEARKIEEDYEKNCPWGNSYWTRRKYILNSPCPWLSGSEKRCGKSYNFDKVRDTSIRG